MLFLFSRIFLIGGCYGFWLNDDPVIKTVGVILALGFGLDLLDKVAKDDQVDRSKSDVKINRKGVENVRR